MNILNSVIAFVFSVMIPILAIGSIFYLISPITSFLNRNFRLYIFAVVIASAISVSGWGLVITHELKYNLREDASKLELIIHDWQGVIRDWQTALSSLIGFAGVMFTLWWNASVNRNLDRAKWDRDKNALRNLFKAEVGFIRKEVSSILRMRSNEEIFPSFVGNEIIWDENISRIGILQPHEAIDICVLHAALKTYQNLGETNNLTIKINCLKSINKIATKSYMSLDDAREIYMILHASHTLFKLMGTSLIFMRREASRVKLLFQSGSKRRIPTNNSTIDNDDITSIDLNNQPAENNTAE